MDNHCKLLLVFLIVVGFLGCDNLKCRPDTHPDKKGGEIGWFYGFRCGGQW